jgi:DNA invertase Pin-like site-specific DNA recombinase
MPLGYARVSDVSQNHDLQMDALRATGGDKVFVETGSGSRSGRPRLAAALEFMQDGQVSANRIRRRTPAAATNGGGRQSARPNSVASFYSIAPSPTR